MASLKLEHIYKIYPNGTKAVNDISLDIENGEFIVFVGPSGCGKSTTLRMIAGLEDITAGELYIDNQIVNDVEPKDRDIAMVFQNYALYPHMSVYENMAFGLRLRHVPEDVIQEKVLWAADILGIKEYLDRKPKAMSGGQRQRVALGRAILRDPKVMLLDEPLSNLDAKLRTQMRTEIAKLHQKLKTTFIYVTHDQVEAMTLGDRVVVMKKGMIQQVDTPKNLYNYPANKFVAGFIGTPQMNFFSVALTRNGENVKVDLTCNKASLSVSYNTLIKVLPSYLDGKHAITMGIRCEHVRSAAPGEANAMPLKVSHFEELGSECLIYGSLNLAEEDISAEKEGNLIVKVKEAGDVKPGQVISVVLDMDHAYFFDSQSEETIVPRIPSYNSLSVAVKANVVSVLGSTLNLPKALAVKDVESAELQVPTDAVHLTENGIPATVLLTEVINQTNLVHLLAGDRVFFAIADKAYPAKTPVHVSFDLTRVTLKEGEKVLFQPLAALDSFQALFYNYQTVISKDNDPEFVKFRDDKIQAAKSFMDAKIVLENQTYEKEKLSLSDGKAQEEASKALTKYNQVLAANKTKIQAIKVASKKTLADLKATYNADKKKIASENNALFADKKAKEEQEYKAFKEHNKDKDALKRRSDEYHIFKDNFPSDKENTLERSLTKLTMDYDSKVSSEKANARRQIDLLSKEIKDSKAEANRAKNPLAYLEKSHQKTLKALEAEKKAAVERAGLVFFLGLPGGYYALTSDIISNKLIQGLGTRVFSKDFRVDMPHDAYSFSTKKNAFKAVVKDNLDYGDVTYVVLSYKDETGTEKTLTLRQPKPLEVGKEVSLDFDVTRSEITETTMAIRLY